MVFYLLDTNIVSYLLDTKSAFHRSSMDRLARLADEDEVGVSVLTYYELNRWFAYRSDADEGTEAVLSDFQVLPLPPAGAKVFGTAMRDLRVRMPRTDAQRVVLDCMIAVTALEHGAVLVSHDALFRQLATFLPGLRVIDWAVP
jgi:predicted nucleic acid-binding protein